MTLKVVISCEITDDHVLNVSRHRPVVCVISTGVLKILISMPNHISNGKKVDEHILQLYKPQLDGALLK